MSWKRDERFLIKLKSLAEKFDKNKLLPDKVLNELYHDEMEKQRAFRNVDEIRAWLIKECLDESGQR